MKAQLASAVQEVETALRDPSAAVLPHSLVGRVPALGFCCSLAKPSRAGTNHGMAKRRRAAQVRPDQSFKGRQFTAEVILWAVRWYLMFPISYRDLELMLADRGVTVDHTTIFRWIQVYGIVKLAGFGARSITRQHCAGVHAAIWAQVSCRHTRKASARARRY